MKNFLLAFVLFISVGLFAQIDPSDGCTLVPTLTQNGTCVANSYTLSGSYSNGGLVNASCQGGNDRDDGWYQFTATTTDVQIDLTGNRRHTLSVWTSCAGGTELGCDYVDGGQTATVILSGLTVGVTYFIQVHRNQSNNSSSMTGDICVHDYVPPANDCSNATQICTDAAFPGSSSGPGTQELNGSNSGCLGVEHESNWYAISIGTSGTLQFTIAPRTASDDYDFAVWGPGGNCPPTVAPIRCSYSASTPNTGVNTGLNTESPETTEGPGGDAYVDDMVVTAGEVYYLLVDNFSASASTFDFYFGGSAGISCVPLDVSLVSYEGYIDNGTNKIEWVTKSETNNAYFTIEKSTNGIDWVELGTVAGANNSSEIIDYSFRDFNPEEVVNYYRLWQTDYDGTKKPLGTITIDNSQPDVQLIKITNIMGQDVPAEYPGVKVFIYSDGTVIKRFNIDE